MATATSQSELGLSQTAANASLADARNQPTRLVWVHDSLALGVVFALVLTIGQRAIGFVRGILFCRLMTDQELGQWSMVWSLLMLLAPLAMLGLPGCFGRYSEHYRQRGQLRIFIFRIGVVSVVMSLMTAAALLIFPATFAEWFFRDSSQTTLIASLALSLVAVAISNFAISLMESLRQVRLVSIMRFVTGLAFAVVGTILIVVCKDNSAAVTLAYGLCCLLGLIPAMWLGWKFRQGIIENGSSLSHQSMWRKIAPFAVWLWLSNLLNNLFEVSDRYMLIHWSDTTSALAQSMVGQYHSGRIIPLLIVSLATVVGGVLLPYMSAAWEDGRIQQATRQLNVSYKLVGLSFTASGILVLIASSFFFDTILQGRYNDGLAVLPLTLVYCIWFSLYTVGQDYLWVAEKGKLATLAVGTGLVANILLNMLFIPYWGLAGAVWATTIGNLIVLLLILVMNHCSGCHTDLGIWLISGTPLVLLLTPWLATLMLVGLCIVAHRTDWLFSPDEKQQGLVVWQGLRSKLKLGDS